MYLWNQRSPSLTGYRPNQAANRVYAGWASPRAQGPLNGMGDIIDDFSQPISVQPNLLLLGLGALAAGFFIFGRKAGPALKKRKIARLAAQRSRISERLKELES